MLWLSIRLELGFYVSKRTQSIEIASTKNMRGWEQAIVRLPLCGSLIQSRWLKWRDVIFWSILRKSYYRGRVEVEVTLRFRVLLILTAYPATPCSNKHACSKVPNLFLWIQPQSWTTVVFILSNIQQSSRLDKKIVVDALWYRMPLVAVVVKIKISTNP